MAEETLHDLVTAIEREQSALTELIEANLEAEAQEEAVAMIARQNEMGPIMARLGEATQRLTEVARAETLPRSLLPKVEAWARELATLLAAIEDQRRDIAARRALIIETLQRLSRTTLGLTGYRQPRASGARFVSGQA
jgi:hypothetical protein